MQVFFYLKCVTSREKFPGGERNLSRLLERAVAGELVGQGKETPEDQAVGSLLQLVAVALGRNPFLNLLFCSTYLGNIWGLVHCGSSRAMMWLSDELLACILC